MSTLSPLDIDFSKVTHITQARSFGKPITDEMRIKTLVEKALKRRGYTDRLAEAQSRAARLLHAGYTMNEALRRVEAWAANALKLSNTPDTPGVA